MSTYRDKCEQLYQDYQKLDTEAKNARLEADINRDKYIELRNMLISSKNILVQLKTNLTNSYLVEIKEQIESIDKLLEFS